MTPQIIFEDQEILVLDKPVGINVTEDLDLSSDTIKAWLQKRFGYKNINGGNGDEFEQRFGIVHRLDKETSGVLLIAKNKETFQYLKGLFKFRRVRKEYQVLVYGRINEDRFEVSAPISRNKSIGTSFFVEEDGRDSITEFKVVKYVVPDSERGSHSPLDSDYTYLHAYPKTGRTHQIRVHLKAFGHPIVNDYKYADRAMLKFSETLFGRMMLHARNISFIDEAGKRREFISPLDLSNLFRF